VGSIPLIAASIMSKKLVEGLHGLVLNVTVGSGAFMSTRDEAATLARAMIALGAAHDCRTVALLSAMDRPLGWACGNALETEEAIHALHGEGPPDLMIVTFALAAQMLRLGGIPADDAVLSRAIASGAAAHKFQEIIEAQGGNPGVVDDPAALPQAPVSSRHLAARSGVLARVDPREVGRGIIALGGGRTRQEDTIDPTVGFVITVKPGERVERDQPLATIYARDDAGLAEGRSTLDRAIVIAEHAEPMLSLIIDRIGA
jgi:thymidine phosphorylase